MGWFVPTIIAVAVGLVTNEIFDVTPWAARRLAVFSARIRYGDSARAEIRAEELVALINVRPGKLLKLATAAWFLITAVATRARRKVLPEEKVEQAFEEGPRLYVPDVPSPITARYLFPTEKYRGEWRRHWISVVKRSACVVCATCLLIVLPFSPPDWLSTGRAAPVMTAIIDTTWLYEIVVVLLGLGGVGAVLLNWFMDRVSISNKRLFRVHGLLIRRATSIPLATAANLQMRQGLPGQIFNYATLVMLGCGRLHPMRRIRDMPNPNEFFLQLMEETHEPEAVDERAYEWSQEFDPDLPDEGLPEAA